MNSQPQSIFAQYFTPQPFVDRFANSEKGAVDVIIPVIHTNELWRENLKSIYREIPVNRLIVGDGGCKDDSIAIAMEFPRVNVLDHTSFSSLGYSLRHLIEAVSTEWFVYVHSDVYLPVGWFELMCQHKNSYDWFGCPQQMTVLAEYRLVDPNRPYAGSQMGRKVAFKSGLGRIEDDYVYRQEDFVLADIVTKSGFKEGRVEDVFHYHQMMHRPSVWARNIRRVAIEVESSRDEEIRSCVTQARGLVKYLEPNQMMALWVTENVSRLVDLGETTWPEFLQWVADTNPSWLTFLGPPSGMFRLKRNILNIMRRFLA